MAFTSESGQAESEYGPKFQNARFNQLVLHTSSLRPSDTAWLEDMFFEGSHRFEKIEIYDFCVKNEEGVECTDEYLPSLLEKITYRAKNIEKNKCKEF